MNNRTKYFSRLKQMFTISMLLACPVVALAQNKVIVIPMSGDDLKPLANVITVAKQNGDFSDPVAAVNSISGANASNPFLVVVAPGVYTIASRITLPSFVSLAGSGPEITKIVGSFGQAGNGGTVIEVNSNVRIEDLTIENNSTITPGNKSAIRGGQANDVVLANLNVIVDNSIGVAPTVGVENLQGQRWIIRDSQFKVTSTEGDPSLAVLKVELAVMAVFNNSLVGTTIVEGPPQICIGNVSLEELGGNDFFVRLNEECELNTG